jgi:hypothetical protein
MTEAVSVETETGVKVGDPEDDGIDAEEDRHQSMMRGIAIPWAADTVMSDMREAARART